jgi:ubiquinone/menaquinone biosynthesis C-methylase UbiE
MDTMTLEEKQLIQARVQARNRAQFSFHTKAYLESKVHSAGKSLERLIEVIQPESHWRVLDVATGAGHTGLAFANIVSHVTAIDLTRPMLETAQEQAGINHQLNIDMCQALAEDLPFKEDVFDLVTCRIAAHHFFSVSKFMAAAARSLKAGGVLAVVDNVVPSTYSEGKKFRHIKETGRYINAFERLRDPSHNRCLGLEEWVEHFYSAGIRLWYSETMTKEVAFGPWVARTHIAPVDIIRLKAMLLQAPQAVKDFLDPQVVGAELAFHLTEGIMVGTKDDS